MEPIPIFKNPSFKQMKHQLKMIADRVNLVTQSGMVLKGRDGAEGEVIFSEKSWAITTPRSQTI